MFLEFNPQTDLEIDRTITAGQDLVWRCWTRPDQMAKWLAFDQNTLQDVRMDPRPGGEFFTRFAKADGSVVDHSHCVLALNQYRFLAFTDGLAPGFRPLKQSSITYTLTLGPDPTGTRHILRMLHKSAAEKNRTIENRTHDRWRDSIGKLAEYANALRSKAR